MPVTRSDPPAANVCARLRNQLLRYGFLLTHGYPYLHATQKSFTERLYHFVTYNHPAVGTRARNELSSFRFDGELHGSDRN